LLGALVPGAAPLLAAALPAIALLGEGPSALQRLGIAAVGCGLWIGCGVLRWGLDRAALR